MKGVNELIMKNDSRKDLFNKMISSSFVIILLKNFNSILIFLKYKNFSFFF